ncbi:MAG TPA: hypothetical protein VK935_11005 [Actinomycetospora sp.]|nr:hypothetical protein [Actinomycetospora sp.]
MHQHLLVSDADHVRVEHGIRRTVERLPSVPDRPDAASGVDGEAA